MLLAEASALMPVVLLSCCWVAFAQENVVENFARKRFRFYVVLAYVLVYGVERHVNGAVAEGFDYPAFTPWQWSSKTCGSGASPLFEPVNDCDEPGFGDFGVNLHLRDDRFGSGLSTLHPSNSGTTGR